jgi:hypothetical protein
LKKIKGERIYIKLSVDDPGNDKCITAQIDKKMLDLVLKIQAQMNMIEKDQAIVLKKFVETVNEYFLQEEDLNEAYGEIMTFKGIKMDDFKKAKNHWNEALNKESWVNNLNLDKE